MTPTDFSSSDAVASWLDAVLQNPAIIAIQMRERYRPVTLSPEDPAVVFPPTYAPKEKNAKSNYQIDTLPNGRSVVTIDSVGSQANRMERVFMNPDNCDLVPQLTVQFKQPNAEPVEKNLLELSHRVADALVRYADDTLSAPLCQAIHAYQGGDAGPLARWAPTSLVFGFWDSRASLVKVPRLLESVMRAWDVTPLTRSSQFIPAVRVKHLDILLSLTDKELQDKGLKDTPATGSPGGVQLNNGSFVHRDLLINLEVLRTLHARPIDGDSDPTPTLHRYLLALALIAAQTPIIYLRQGTLLRRHDRSLGLALTDNDSKLLETLPSLETLRTIARACRPSFGPLPDSIKARFEASKAEKTT